MKNTQSIKTINDFINEKDFFIDRNVSVNSIIGLGVGFLLEEAKIPDFTTKGYAVHCKKELRDYVNELNQALQNGALHRFFDPIQKTNIEVYSVAEQQKIVEKVKYTAQMITPVLQAHINGQGGYLIDAFNSQYEMETDPERKSELQLMELVMLSRVYSENEKAIKYRFKKIDANSVQLELLSVYNLAKKYFG